MFRGNDHKMANGGGMQLRSRSFGMIDELMDDRDDKTMSVPDDDLQRREQGIVSGARRPQSTRQDKRQVRGTGRRSTRIEVRCSAVPGRGTTWQHQSAKPEGEMSGDKSCCRES